MRKLTVLLLSLLFIAQALRAQIGVTSLESFEKEGALGAWQLTSVDGEITGEKASEGFRSAHLAFHQRQESGPWPMAVLRLGPDRLPSNDWRGYEKLQFDITNTSGEVIELRAGLRDSTGGRQASGTFSIAPRGSKTCEIPVNRIYRKVEPIYLGRSEKDNDKAPEFLSFYLVLIAEQDFYLDNVRLTADTLKIEDAALLDDPFGRGEIGVACGLSRAAQCDVRVYDQASALVARHVQLTDNLDWRWSDPEELATLPPGTYRAELTVTDVKWDPDSPLRRELGTFRIVPEEQAPQAVAWYVPSTRKVMLDGRPEKGAGVITWAQITGEKGGIEPLKIEMARNEYEGGQVVFLSRGKTMRLEFEIKDLKNAKTGEPFPLEGGGIYQVGYVNTNDPVYYEVDRIGWWPDALLPAPQMYARPGECMPVWVNLKSGAATPPGTYRGRLEVRVDGLRAGAIPLEVRLCKAVLPTVTTLRTAFTFSDELIEEINGGKLPAGLLRKYHQFIADHRLNVDNIYRSSPPDIETVEYFSRRGQLNAFNLMYVGGRVEQKGEIESEGYLQSLAAVLDPYVAELRKRGLADKAYIYGFDEIGGEMYGMVKKTFGFLKTRYPEIPTITTGRDASFGLDSGLDEAVDIWVPLTPVYDLERAKAARARGREVWWYTCISPPHPYANWYIEYPALEPRLLWWMTYQQRVPGYLYYFTNLRHGQTELMRIDGHNKTNWNPASWRTANGDGCFIYSGPDGPVSTIRCENIRDGLEDTELLYLLEKKLGDGGTAGLALCGELIKSLTEYTGAVQKFGEVRRALLELLEGTE